jgi:hypothetical protein
MSQIVQAIEQLKTNANDAAISTPKEIDYVAVVEKNAVRILKANQATRFHSVLNQSKLFSACCAEVKSMLGGDKTGRLPNEIASKISDAITTYQQKMIAQVNPANVQSVIKSFRHSAKDMAVIEQIRATGHNSLPLNEQHLGIVILISQAERRLTALQAKPTPDLDAEANCKESIKRLSLTKFHIEACQAAAKAEDK